MASSHDSSISPDGETLPGFWTYDNYKRLNRMLGDAIFGFIGRYLTIPLLVLAVYYLLNKIIVLFTSDRQRNALCRTFANHLNTLVNVSSITPDHVRKFFWWPRFVGKESKSRTQAPSRKQAAH